MNFSAELNQLVMQALRSGNSLQSIMEDLNVQQQCLRVAEPIVKAIDEVGRAP